MGSAPRSDPLVKTYEGCHWEPDPLNRIATLFRGQAELTDVVFSTRLKAHTFSEKTLRALRAAVNKSFVPGDRDRVENLSISAAGPGHRVSLVINDTASTYRVESENSTWNSGVAHQLDE